MTQCRFEVGMSEEVASYGGSFLRFASDGVGGNVSERMWMKGNAECSLSAPTDNCVERFGT